MNFTFKEYIKTCKKSSTSMYQLGVCYFYGDGTNKDKAKALKCFLAAAKMQNPSACKQLASSYKSGDIVQKDIEKSKEYQKLFEEYSVSETVANRLKREEFLAAEIIFKKRKTGAYDLGVLYFESEDEKTKAKAYKCFMKAATKHNNMLAMQKLEECYTIGCGCDIDKNKAFFWGQKYLRTLKAKNQKSPAVDIKLDYHKKINAFDTPLEKFEKKTNLLCCPECRNRISCIETKEEGILQTEEAVDYDDGTTGYYTRYDPDGITTIQIFKCEKCKASFYKFTNKKIDYTPKIHRDSVKKTITTIRYESITEMTSVAENVLKEHGDSFEIVEKIKDKY